MENMNKILAIIIEAEMTRNNNGKYSLNIRSDEKKRRNMDIKLRKKN